MKVLAFDQSVNGTAAALLISDESTKLFKVDKLFECKVPSAVTGLYKLAYVKRWIEDIIQSNDCDLLVRELHNQRQFGAASQLQVVSWFIDELALKRKFDQRGKYFKLPNTTWKKFVFGKGNMKKDTAYLVHMNDFFQTFKYLDEPLGFKVLNDNLGDAICLGLTAVIMFMAGNDEFVYISETKKKELMKSYDAAIDHGSDS